ncbi:MAG: cyclic nucleotide-binding domain-containing protein [Oscillochloridaceae bacterium umkhey_bin13]
MLSVLERVLVLKAVTLFAATPDPVLYEIAALVSEEEHAAGSVVVAQGASGSSMYVVVAGRLRVYDGPRTLNHLESRAVFGEMALLDPEPRAASVTALEDSLLLRIDHAPFHELLADRSEVAQSLIRILAGYVRERLDDLANAP